MSRARRYDYGTGKWILDARTRELYHEDWSSYRVDLDAITTSAKCLDVIMQVTQKTPYSKEDVADFIEAIRKYVDPQKDLCSWGIERGKR